MNAITMRTHFFLFWLLLFTGAPVPLGAEYPIGDKEQKSMSEEFYDFINQLCDETNRAKNEFENEFEAAKNKVIDTKKQVVAIVAIAKVFLKLQAGMQAKNAPEKQDQELTEEQKKEAAQAREQVAAIRENLAEDKKNDEKKKDEDSQAEDREIREALKRDNEIIFDHTFRIPSYTEQYNAREGKRERLEQKDKKVGVSFALYRKDIARIGFTGVHYLIEYIYHKKFIQERQNYIFEHLKKNADEVIKLLDAVDAAQAQEDAEAERDKTIGQSIKGFFSAPPTKKPIKEFADYLNKEHCFIGFTKLRSAKKMFLPMAAKFLSQEVLQGASKTIMNRKVDFSRPKESLFAYRRNDKGELVPDKDFTLVPSMLQYILPFLSVEGFLSGGFYTDINIPGFSASTLANFLIDYKFASSEKTKKILHAFASPQAFMIYGLLYRAFITYYALVIYDSIFQELWIDYLLKHKKELRTVLQPFIKQNVATQQTQQTSLFGSAAQPMLGAATVNEEYDAALRDFIKQGHKSTSFIPFKLFGQWLPMKGAARARIGLLVACAIAIPVLWKGIPLAMQWFKYV